MRLPQVKLDLEKITSLYPMIEEEKLVAVQNANPKLLIGSNNAGLIVPLKAIQYSLDGLQLTRCHLGWTIHGQIEPANDIGGEIGRAQAAADWITLVLRILQVSGSVPARLAVLKPLQIG